MYFHIDDNYKTPCGGSIHFAVNRINRSPRRSIIDANFQFSYNLEQTNGEKANFTHESGTYEGTKY